MIVKPTPIPEIIKFSEYRDRGNGYQDRCCGLPPQETSRAYFSGYCERIIFEIDRDAALDSDSVA